MPDIINTVTELENLFSKSFIRTNKWSSSAKQLDDDISDAGFDISLKFFHRYKLPKPIEIMVEDCNNWWLLSDYNKQIEKLENFLNKEIILSDELKNRLFYVKSSVIQEINSTTEYIKKNNPELNSIKTPTTENQIHFIRGAVYGYPPENIEFWVNNYPNDTILNEAFCDVQLLKKQFGINVGLMRLTKKQSTLLLSVLSNKQINNKIINTAVHSRTA